MSAFGGKADMTFYGRPLSRSLVGAKRTCRFALHMSAYDPKRTFKKETTSVNYIILWRCLRQPILQVRDSHRRVVDSDRRDFGVSAKVRCQPELLYADGNVRSDRRRFNAICSALL